jgi:uncharacterized protein YceK
MIRRFLESAGHLVAGTLAAFGLLALTVLLAGCQPAESQIPGDVLTWTAPTQRTDGSALPAAQIANYRIQWGTNPSGPFNVGQEIVPGTVTTVTIGRTGYGTRCYTAVTIDTNGLESAPSNTACKTLVAPPNPPVLTVN